MVPLEVGSQVTVDGFLAAPELNGRRGKVLRHDGSNGDWHVDFGTDGVKVLKEEHLSVVEVREATDSVDPDAKEGRTPEAAAGEAPTGQNENRKPGDSSAAPGSDSKSAAPSGASAGDEAAVDDGDASSGMGGASVVAPADAASRNAADAGSGAAVLDGDASSSNRDVATGADVASPCAAGIGEVATTADVASPGGADADRAVANPDVVWSADAHIDTATIHANGPKAGEADADATAVHADAARLADDTASVRVHVARSCAADADTEAAHADVASPGTAGVDGSTQPSNRRHWGQLDAAFDTANVGKTGASDGSTAGVSADDCKSNAVTADTATAPCDVANPTVVESDMATVQAETSSPSAANAEVATPAGNLAADAHVAGATADDGASSVVSAEDAAKIANILAADPDAAAAYGQAAPDTGADADHGDPSVVDRSTEEGSADALGSGEDAVASAGADAARQSNTEGPGTDEGKNATTADGDGGETAIAADSFPHRGGEDADAPGAEDDDSDDSDEAWGDWTGGGTKERKPDKKVEWSRESWGGAAAKEKAPDAEPDWTRDSWEDSWKSTGSWDAWSSWNEWKPNGSKEGASETKDANASASGDKTADKDVAKDGSDSDDSWGDWNDKGLHPDGLDPVTLGKLPVRELKLMLSKRAIEIPKGLTEKKELIDLFFTATPAKPAPSKPEGKSKGKSNGKSEGKTEGKTEGNSRGGKGRHDPDQHGRERDRHRDRGRGKAKDDREAGGAGTDEHKTKRRKTGREERARDGGQSARGSGEGDKAHGTRPFSAFAGAGLGGGGGSAGAGGVVPGGVWGGLRESVGPVPKVMPPRPVAPRADLFPTLIPERKMPQRAKPARPPSFSEMYQGMNQPEVRSVKPGEGFRGFGNATVVPPRAPVLGPPAGSGVQAAPAQPPRMQPQPKAVFGPRQGMPSMPSMPFRPPQPRGPPPPHLLQKPGGLVTGPTRPPAGQGAPASTGTPRPFATTGGAQEPRAPPRTSEEAIAWAEQRLRELGPTLTDDHIHSVAAFKLRFLLSDAVELGLRLLPLGLGLQLMQERSTLGSQLNSWPPPADPNEVVVRLLAEHTDPCAREVAAMIRALLSEDASDERPIQEPRKIAPVEREGDRTRRRGSASRSNRRRRRSRSRSTHRRNPAEGPRSTDRRHRRREDRLSPPQRRAARDVIDRRPITPPRRVPSPERGPDPRGGGAGPGPYNEEDDLPDLFAGRSGEARFPSPLPVRPRHVSGVRGKSDGFSPPASAMASSAARPAGGNASAPAPCRGEARAPHTTPQDSGPPGANRELEEWLYSLDGGKGALLRYLDPLSREFGSLALIGAAAKVPNYKEQNMSLVDSVEKLFFEALGVQSLGHRLLLAKGVLALD
mmetsp:Transcript_121885/g.344744  ORF Transcript_121885/g.344744 Transcript_121885/m.344744 type:complete len:1374 (+) Transcript_121885:189-4310(+)